MCLLILIPFSLRSLKDFLDTIESAYLYAKTVTLGETHWPETNRVLLRNRRIGCSMSGIAQFITKRGLLEYVLLKILQRRFDKFKNVEMSNKILFFIQTGDSMSLMKVAF
jgi:hypothetical protein